MQVYFEADFFIIKYSEANHVVVNKWTTTPTSDEFREAMEVLLRAMIDFKASKVISDTTCMGALLLEDQEWAASDWYMRAIEVGFSYNAIIISSDLFSEMSVQGTLDSVADSVTVNRYFSSMEDAMVWISKF
ncbi:hypothetical protein [Ohtaekwangia koreensis]|uniref:SpoIIAA-like n=1 Tax=Ohtaekwangia koreensis TaxID=688867 RepID=A0A1T5LSJ8_9BACT|nr:hypothetical protein [Ohtaekwangia koreensis]SKC78956.1 hypothetical protein SAMN05660236_3843 [Ohtaekwangia koreensis]